MEEGKYFVMLNKKLVEILSAYEKLRSLYSIPSPTPQIVRDTRKEKLYASEVVEKIKDSLKLCKDIQLYLNQKRIFKKAENLKRNANIYKESLEDLRREVYIILADPIFEYYFSKEDVEKLKQDISRVEKDYRKFLKKIEENAPCGI